MKGDRRRVNIYLPVGVLAEVKAEAARQGRTISWLMRKAWEVARGRITMLPEVPR